MADNTPPTDIFSAFDDSAKKRACHYLQGLPALWPSFERLDGEGKDMEVEGFTNA